MRFHPRLWLIPFAVLLHPAPLPAQEMAVSSKVFNGYSREQLPDGTFKPELYVFGEGGCWTRPVNDPWMDKLKFAQIGQIIAGPLAKLNYRPAFKAADAGLLILVFWGSTEGSIEYGGDSFRDMLDERNARILGYSAALAEARSAAARSVVAQDVISEVGDNRYYVVLQAYDFKTAVKEKKLKPLWVTRMSLHESGAFAPALEEMVLGAARYFGRDSDGLLRGERERNGTVELGPLKVIETAPPGGTGDAKRRP